MLALLLALLLSPAALADEECGPDTIRYGTHRQTNFIRVGNDQGEAMGQFFELPAPMVLTGIEASVYGEDDACDPNGVPCLDGVSTFTLSASVYNVDSDGLPTGTPLGTSVVEVPCVCSILGPEDARVIFPMSQDVALTDDYAVTVSNDQPGATMWVYTNDPRVDDGNGEDRGLYYYNQQGPGGIQWYSALDVSVALGQSVQADADVYVHPQVEFTYPVDFVPTTSDGDECPEAGTEITIDPEPMPILESATYNRHVLFNDDELVSEYDFGDGNSESGSSVTHTYSSADAFVVTRTVRYDGWATDCTATATYAFDEEQEQFYDCDADGVTGSDSGMYCGAPVARGDECGAQGPSEFATTDQGDCDDADPFTFPNAPEECDGDDNDCDGFVDDDIDPLPDDPVFGECADNVVVCVDGAFVSDPSNVVPQDEACDGLDNDCNGLEDDGIAPIPADNVVGACADNVQTCTDGSFVPSVDNHEPRADVCDGIDNDCDAATADGADDSRLGEPCDGDDADTCETGVLSCDGGTLVCSDDAAEDDCDPDTDTDTEDDSDDDSDTDGDSDPTSEGSVRCGCATSTGPASLVVLPLMGLLLLRRRRS